eukprot:2595998-Prymnesium_polylepis.1
MTPVAVSHPPTPCLHSNYFTVLSGPRSFPPKGRVHEHATYIPHAPCVSSPTRYPFGALSSTSSTLTLSVPPRSMAVVASARAAASSSHELLVL